MSNWHVRRAAQAVRAGGVIAYPTEAVWGLGCDPYNEAALETLLAIKSRPREKGVILVAADMAQLEPLLVRLTPAEREQLAATWPGPYTWLIPDPDNLIPEWVKGQHASVAVRVSDHPLVQALCRELGSPLVSTSANPASQEPARNKLRVRQYFGDTLAYIVPGELGGLAQPTQIRDLRNDRLVRP